MNREQAHAILDMRLDGMTWEEIGKEMGTSRQNVYQKLGKLLGRNERRAMRIKLLFPGLKQAMEEKGLSTEEIAVALGVSPETTVQKLTGHRPFKKQEIDRLIQITGADYQTLFGGTEGTDETDE